MALVMLGVLPALGLMVFGYVEQREVLIQSAQNNAWSLISNESRRWEFIVERIRGMLTNLAAEPGIKTLEQTTCSVTIQSSLRNLLLTTYSNVGVADLEGNVICSLLPLPGNVNIADRSYFRDAVSTRGFSMGEYQFGRITKIATVNFGCPILNEAGEVRGVVFVAADVSWFSDLLDTASLPVGAVLTFIDNKGVVLARYPDSESWVGRTAPDREVIEWVLKGGRGSIEAVGADGIPRRYVFRQFGNTADAGFVYLGTSEEAAAGRARQSLIRNLIALGLAAAAGLAAVWIFAHFLVMRGIKTLIGASQQVASGDFGARTNLGDSGGEFGEMGRVFDQMAATLQRRENERREAEHSILIFRSFVEASGQGMAMATLDGVVTYVNPTLLRWGNSQSPDEVTGKRITDLLPEEERARMTDEITPAVLSTGQWIGEMTFRSSGGALFHSILNDFLIRDNEGQPRYRAAIITDITQRKLSEEKLRDALEFQRRLLSTAATGIFTLDMEGTLTMVNEEFCFITGYEREEIVGEQYAVLGDTTYLDTLDLSETEMAPSIQRREGSLLTKDGRTLSVLMNHTPLTNEEGAVTGFIVSFVDVTEEIEARQAAEKAALVKSEFLANMSHEIRTPIHGIVGMTELTLNTELTAEQREYLHAVRSSADSLMRLINDILDFSKMEAGKLELVDIDFSLRDSIGEVLTTLAVQAHSKGLELLSHISHEIPDSLMGDPGRLRQVIVNLVGNAIKFTDEGEVSLEVALESEKDSRVWLHFAVRDTGIGIPEEKQLKIFHAFEQADGSTTRRFEGTGLGLAISSHLVELMGGKIWVESEIGTGSTFHFTVHLAVRKTPAAPHVAAARTVLKEIHILVVDDNATNRRILEETLLYWGMKPTSADSGRTGWAAVVKAFEDGNPFRLIITDCMMPEMDGFEFAQRIKSDPRFESIPVIMLTSAGQRGDGVRCFTAKIAAYLHKPIRQSDLLGAISRLLQAASDNVAIESLITRHTIRETQRKLRILLAEDNIVNQKLASKMLQKMGHTVTVAGNGKAAVEAAGKETFDLILMDVQMPEMDGLQSTKIIRDREQGTGKHIPIIAMTAYAMKGDRERCLAAGMDGYVSKPVSVSELYEALEKSEPAVSAAEPPVGHSLVLDRKAVCDQFGGDKKLLKEIAGIFLEDCNGLCSRIRDAINRRDAEALKRNAHALKGSVASFAAHAAFQEASSLEALGRLRDFHQAHELLDRLEKELERVRAELEDLVSQHGSCKGTEAERNS